MLQTVKNTVREFRNDSVLTNLKTEINYSNSLIDTKPGSLCSTTCTGRIQFIV
jgi:hypothetical protein